MRGSPRIAQCKIRNFKSIRDSRMVKLNPINFLIGWNGSGKSSFLEALEAHRAIALHGAEEGLKPWGGFQAIRHQGAPAGEPTQIQLRIDLPDPNPPKGKRPRIRTQWNMEIEGGQVREELQILDNPEGRPKKQIFNALRAFAESWQFLKLNPEVMRGPSPADAKEDRLEADGSNLGAVLHAIHEDELHTIEDSMRFVLPEMEKMQAAKKPERRNRLPRMKEGGALLPEIAYSQGMLRILALLTQTERVGENKSAPVVFIEEIENGIDPRVAHMILELMRSEAYYNGTTQFIATTHSPYWMNIMMLKEILRAYRDPGGSRFWRPQGDRWAQSWHENHSPGEMYTLGVMLPEKERSRGDAPGINQKNRS